MMKDWKTIYSVKGPKTMMEMTAVELMEAMKETKTIILSFGAIENHGAHLPLGADYYQAEALIRCTYEALLEKGHKTIPGFAVPFGTQTNQFERQGEHLVGNAYLFEKVFIDMTESLILSLHETGFEKFILIINHSENQAALHVAAKDLATDTNSSASYGTGWRPTMISGRWCSKMRSIRGTAARMRRPA